METSIIITICVLLLLAYIFDISSHKTKIPAVILLLVLGWLVKQAVLFFEIPVPVLTPVLPVIGTIGLILIVLEGSLELEFDKSKLSFISRSALMALLPIILLSFGLGYAFYYFEDISFKKGLSNAIPLAIVSSAIAIPSAKSLSPKNREFITYESSLSDIFGVIFFNFIILNETINTGSFGIFILDIVIILLVTVLSCFGLSFLLRKIQHHVKYVPIILFIVLIYAMSKIYHLPALVFILLFGLFLGNIDELKHYDFIQKLQPDILNKEVIKLKDLTMEFSFLIRALFFILFGYLIEISELLNLETMTWAIVITLGIFILRYILLKIFKLPTQPILFVSPRGLITILLFLTIPVNQKIEIVNKSLIIQVIILTAVVMMIGLMIHAKPRKKN